MPSVVLMTGSTSGLGRAAAQACLAAGAKVVISSECPEAVEATLAEFSDYGEAVTGQVCDVTSVEQVEALSALAQERFGKIDCWINNAGTTAPSGDGDLVPRAMGELLIRVNTLGTYHGSVTAMRQFRRQGHGRLINITGRGERGPVKHAALYCASKSWLRTFTLSLAAEQKGSSISAHTFNPGMMYTELTARPRVLKGNEDAQLKGLRMVMPLIGDPPERSGAALARFALVEKPPAAELRSRRLLPLVLGRLLSGRRAAVDLEAIEPRIIEPETS